MLEDFSENNVLFFYKEKFPFGFPICDSHLHLVQCLQFEDITDFSSGDFSSSGFTQDNYFCATCVHSKEEWQELEKLNLPYGSAARAFGIHPQNPEIELLDFMEKLVSSKKIDAVGEIGFDLFEKKYAENLELQEKAFALSLEIAIGYDMPVVIHERKALHLVYRYAERLKKLPSVLFHSFPLGLYEAKSLLSKGINAYFSFGKQILNGNKKAIECVKFLPISHLLLETDAPFQSLRGEKFTGFKEILRVYEAGLALRDEKDFESFFRTLKNNFMDMYKMRK